MPELTEQVRKEIAPFAKASQGPQHFAVPELPQLKVDSQALVDSCPLFKACYYECLRLDYTPTSIRSVKQDFALTETHTDILSGEHSATYVLKAGTLVAVPLNAHLNDPRYVDSPGRFNPARFLVQKADGSGTQIAEAGTLRPFGGGQSACPGRHFAEREIMAFVAGILMLWDIGSISSKGCAMPGHKPVVSVDRPSTDIKVRIRRRKLL